MNVPNQITTVSPSQLVTGLKACISASRPVDIWGKPGVGKSDIVKQLARAESLELRDIRASLLDPVDLRGLPYVANGFSKWAVPEFLPTTGKGILFLDELNRSVTMVQNALLQLTLTRQLGEYTLPTGWNIVAACNYESDGGGITKMISALGSRFIHFNLEPSVDDWSKWAVANGIEPAVIAFIRFRSELLHAFDRNSRTFPCPRTWEFVSQICATQPDPAVEHALFAGTVGEGAAIEFSAFVRLYRSIPSIDAILLNPASAPVPQNDPASLYAISSALARRCTVQNISRVLTYADRMPAEYSILTVKDAVGRDTTLTATNEFTKWAVTHSEVLF